MSSETPAPPSVPEAVRAWDRFWFEPSRPTSLAVLRIAVGLIVLYVHLMYTFQLYEFFGADAWVNLPKLELMRREAPVPWMTTTWDTLGPPLGMPDNPRDIEAYASRWGGMDRRYNYVEGTPIWSIWFHVTDPTAMAVVHVLFLLAAILFTLGFATRITSVLTWIAAMSYIHRSQTTLFGMDTMMNILLIYLMIAPCGAALSLDRLIVNWRRKAIVPVEPSRSATFATRLIQIHFCIIYLASGTSKLLGSSWWGCTALWYTWANYEFAPFQYQMYQSFLVWLANHRVLWEVVMTGGVAFTLFVEIGLPFLIWLPSWRWVMISGSVIMHVGIALTMGLTTFGMLMLCMVFAFVPVETVERILARIPFLRSSLA
jgi:uncharacterized membrane protein YphA (DoxX/SURF4 family)